MRIALVVRLVGGIEKAKRIDATTREGGFFETPARVDHSGSGNRLEGGSALVSTIGGLRWVEDNWLVATQGSRASSANRTARGSELDSRAGVDTFTGPGLGSAALDWGADTNDRPESGDERSESTGSAGCTFTSLGWLERVIRACSKFAQTG